MRTNNSKDKRSLKGLRENTTDPLDMQGNSKGIHASGRDDKKMFPEK
jgi:hypothetical protein